MSWELTLKQLNAVSKPVKESKVKIPVFTKLTPKQLREYCPPNALTTRRPMTSK